MAPNYVLGSPINQEVYGMSYQILKNSVLSINLDEGRACKISLMSAPNETSSIKYLGKDVLQESIDFKVMRGNEVIGSSVLDPTISVFGAWTWMDFKAIGAATYRIETKAECGIEFKNIVMFLEQL